MFLSLRYATHRKPYTSSYQVNNKLTESIELLPFSYFCIVFQIFSDPTMNYVILKFVLLFHFWHTVCPVHPYYILRHKPTG
jgi:hypothetical protein